MEKYFIVKSPRKVKMKILQYIGKGKMWKLTQWMISFKINWRKKNQRWNVERGQVPSKNNNYPAGGKATKAGNFKKKLPLLKEIEGKKIAKSSWRRENLNSKSKFMAVSTPKWEELADFFDQRATQN